MTHSLTAILLDAVCKNICVMILLKVGSGLSWFSMVAASLGALTFLLANLGVRVLLHDFKSEARTKMLLNGAVVFHEACMTIWVMIFLRVLSGPWWLSIALSHVALTYLVFTLEDEVLDRLCNWEMPFTIQLYANILLEQVCKTMSAIIILQVGSGPWWWSMIVVSLLVLTNRLVTLVNDGVFRHLNLQHHIRLNEATSFREDGNGGLQGRGTPGWRGKRVAAYVRGEGMEGDLRGVKNWRAAFLKDRAQALLDEDTGRPDGADYMRRHSQSALENDDALPDEDPKHGNLDNWRQRCLQAMTLNIKNTPMIVIKLFNNETKLDPPSNVQLCTQQYSGNRMAHGVSPIGNAMKRPLVILIGLGDTERDEIRFGLGFEVPEAPAETSAETLEGAVDAGDEAANEVTHQAAVNGPDEAADKVTVEAAATAALDAAATEVVAGRGVGRCMRRIVSGEKLIPLSDGGKDVGRGLGQHGPSLSG
ncbi:hypothetical protein FPV67DRAFT_1460817 [Lyophyllum atratum]|nr:hypothetical protein FPV67DRAFT_1460817 [Lyophyllum atratum]